MKAMDFLRFYTKKYPGIWSELKMLNDYNENKRVPEWPKWCYVPIDVVEADLFNRDVPEPDMTYDATLIEALALWRQSKEIFVFDEDFERVLDTQKTEKIPTEAFDKMPYSCVYVKLNNTCFTGCKLDGFFAHLEYDSTYSEKRLKIVFVLDDTDISKEISTVAGILLMDTDTIEDSVRYMASCMGIDPDELYGFYNETGFIDIFNRAIQMLLYICSENAQISQAKGSRPKRIFKIRDTVKEVRTWDVGDDIGKRIRQFRQNPCSDAKQEQKAEPDEDKKASTHKSPVPHMRRGHWHHFWTGKRNDPKNRKLVLRWIPPTFISGTQVNHVTEVYI